MAGIFARTTSKLGQLLGGTVAGGARAVWGTGLLQGGGRLLGRAAYHGGGVGLRTAGKMAKQAATVGLGAARGVVELGAGAAATTYRSVNWMAGGKLFKKGEKLFEAGGHSFHMPRLSGRMEDTLVAGAIGLGVAGGIYDYARSETHPGGSGWNVTQSAANGQLEIEQDHFMGATGSLVMAMHQQRFGRKGGPLAPGDTSATPFGNARYLADDVIMSGMRMIR